ncbi:hypothetical protein D1007_49426 [Hordeum vulgare]|nr:hypothetical protein D1007_49426 [Hordeum vulgare]
MGLTSEDFVATFISCHVQPLQARPHQICDMSGPKDPCRLSTMEQPLHKVAARVNYISGFQLDEEEWSFGMEPYHQANRAPLMFVQQNTLHGPHPEHFVTDLEDSDSEDYESDGGGHDALEGSGVMEDGGEEDDGGDGMGESASAP